MNAMNQRQMTTEDHHHHLHPSRLGDLLQNVYTASTSTIYGGEEDEEEVFTSDSDEGTPRRRRPAPLLQSPEADRMRKELKYFFMNPIEKWKARRRFPWNLLVQISKVVLITSQLILYAEQHTNHESFHDGAKTTFSHLFIETWESTDEILSYPPNGGPIAVYKQSEFFEYLDYAIGNFANIRDVSLGTFEHKRFRNGTVNPAHFCTTQFGCYESCMTNTLGINETTVTKCIEIPPLEVNVTDWSLRRFLEDQEFMINFQLLSHAKLHFVLHNIRMRVKLPDSYPTCHLLDTTLNFDNKIGGSQMVVTLDSSIQSLKCKGELDLTKTRETTKVWRDLIDFVALATCLLSIALCSRSLHRARRLRKKTNTFFEEHIGRSLTNKEQWEFVNMWYVIICINDVILIVGIYVKLGLVDGDYLNKEYSWSICAICLGVGNFLAWVGILRYFGFFKTYNMLMLTLKKCSANVLRSSICILLLFFGYTFAGWLILGPYHIKFQTFMSSVECLYSLINGDDMFASFFSTSGQDPVIWYFSRVYLYSFISLFMWVILSVFLAVIMDAYETIKTYYEEGFPRTGLMKFVSECSARSVRRDAGEREHTLHDTINSICCCFHGSAHNSSDYQKIT